MLFLNRDKSIIQKVLVNPDSIGPESGQTRLVVPKYLQLSTQCSPLVSVDSHLALDMLEEPNLVERPGAASDVHVDAKRVPIGGIDASLLVDLVRLADVLGRHVGPLFGQVHHGAGVHEPVTEFVGHLPLHPVQDPAGLLLEGSRPRG